jgi:hypothetical protein
MWITDFLGRSFLIQLIGRTHFSGLQMDPSLSSTPDELASLADLFRQVQSMDLVKEASQMIQHLIRTNVCKLVISSAQLLQMDDIEPSVAFQALCVIRQAFTPQGAMTRAMIATHWDQIDPNLRVIVHQAALRGLMYDNRSVIGIASLVFALVLACEREAMFHLIPHLFSLVDDEGCSLDTKVGAINTLGEICDPQILGRPAESEAVQDFLSPIYDQLDLWMSMIGQLPECLQLSLLRTMNAFMLIGADYLQQPGKRDQFLSRVMPLLEIGSPMAPFRCIMVLLATFVKRQYCCEDFKFDAIGDLTLAVIQANSGQYAAAAMEFWIDVATEERRISKKYEQYEQINYLLRANKDMKSRIGEVRFAKPFEPRKLAEYAAVQISQRVIEFLMMIDPNSDEDDDPSAHLPHQSATVLLQKLFKAAPQVVFDAVCDFWQRSPGGQDIRELPWTHQHALILSLSCIIRRPINSHVRDDFLLSTLAPDKHMPILPYLVTGIRAPFPIVQGTSLYVIRLYIKTYRMMMSSNAVMPVLRSMTELLETAPSPVIVWRIFVVLKAMIITSEGTNFLKDHFDDVYRFPLFALERQDAMETVIFSQAHFIICMLIEKAPNSLQGRVHEILEKTLQSLSEMCEVEFQESMTQFLQEKFRIVMCCFYRFGTQFQADGIQTANILFTLMRNKNSAIWEEALMSLIHIITQLHNRVAEFYTTERITDLIKTGL